MDEEAESRKKEAPRGSNSTSREKFDTHLKAELSNHRSEVGMLRVMMIFTLLVLAFGWFTGMTIYKVLQLVFAALAVIIMLLVGNVLLGLMSKN